MVIKHAFEGRVYRLVNSRSVDPDKNAFTVLVGKNGTGKSRLMSSIIEHLTQLFRQNRATRLPNMFDQIGIDGIDVYPKPSKVIAVSTSPFDRFPLTKYRRAVAQYSYLGIRELVSHNFGLAYMSKVVGALIEAIIKEPVQAKRIANALGYLGYTDRIVAEFNTRNSQRLITEFLKAGDSYKVFEELFGIKRPFMTINRAFFENEDGSLSKNKINQLTKALRRMRSADFVKIYTTVEIDKYGIKQDNAFPIDYDDLIFFVQSGVIKLRDIILHKIDSNNSFSIKSASSGEQSTIVSLLGIASQIRDYSVICIDEPEVCLHPEWQERYIQLLVDTFCTYKGCHFIIATHSPQIVSKLTSKNAFILSMENEQLIPAIEVVNHSADFQLANVFNSPGFRNEFLTRIALNTFTKVSRNKTFDKEDEENYNILHTQSEFIAEDDPVLDLCHAIDELYKIYGSHK